MYFILFFKLRAVKELKRLGLTGGEGAKEVRGKGGGTGVWV